MHFIQRQNMNLKLSQQRTFYKLNAVILVWTLALLIVLSIVSGAGGSDLSCQRLKAVLGSRKLNDRQVSREPTSGERFKVCAKESRKCCSEEEESMLIAESRKEHSSAVKLVVKQLGSLLHTRSKKLDDFFQELLSVSKRDFDKMFKKTYGVIYEQNSYVFTDLFEELEKYYKKGQVDLEEAMENFFVTLYQKMFTVLNSQYEFDDKYLVCIGEYMKELLPFGDVPQKLSVQIKRSFVATRTYAQALNMASDVVDKMLALGSAGDCSHALMRMSYCPLCRGIPEVKPCNNFCLNVMKGCLAYHSELDTEWNNFVVAMDKVSDRLLGPFNIELVVEPINIKISEAIMNFQENAHEVSEKVFSGCGRLPLGRRARDSHELELETLSFTSEDSKDQQQHQPSLEKLIKDIRAKVKESKMFWSKLPYHICNNDKVSETTEKECWNGTAVAKYTRKVWDNGLSNQQNNPEVAIDTTRPKSILNDQVFHLKTVTSKLKDAYNGFDVNWVDNEESSSIDSGSGDGSGDDSIEVEGSGGGSIHHNRDFDREKNRNEDDEGDDDDEEEQVHHHHTPKHPVSSNDESNIIPKNTDDLMTRSGNNIYSPNSSTDVRSQITLMKAVVTYLFPICVVWLGGLLSDWL